MNNKIPNGGFPLIYFCLNKTTSANKNKNREITSNIKNINIRQIINNNNNDIIKEKKDKEEIDTI
jgi:hypothetical protein